MAPARGRFVGRDDDLALFGEAVQRARSGVRVTLLLEGEAGIGKSRLVAEAVEKYRADDDALSVGHGVELAGGELPYGLVSDSLRCLTRDVGAEAVREAADAVVPDLAAVCPALGPHDGTLDRDRLLQAYVATMEALAGNRLLWLVIEDLHWADVSSRDLVNYLIRVAGPCQLLTIVTIRSEDPETDPAVPELVATWSVLDGVQHHTLQPLDDDDVTELVSDLTGAQAAPRQVRRLISQGQGSPLLTEQLVAAGLDTAPTLPDALISPTLARLRQLDPDARRLLQLASLADGHLAHRLLVQVFSADGHADDTAFDIAVAGALDARFLRYDAAERSYSFSHALLRHAVETTLRPGDRLRAHRRWAELLSRPHVHRGDARLRVAAAHHWAETDADVEAFEAALEAAEVTGRLFGWAETSVLLGRALALWDRVPDPGARAGRTRAQLVGQMLFACGDAGRWAMARDIVDAELQRPQTAQLAPMDMLGLRVARSGISGYLAETRDWAPYDEALGSVDEILAMDSAPSPYLINLLWSTGWRLRYTDPERSLRLHERSVTAARQLNSPRHLVGSLGNVATQLCLRGRTGDALALLEREASAINDPQTRRWILECREEALFRAGDFRSALTLVETDLGRLSPDLNPAAWLVTTLTLCQSLVALGEWDRATTACERVQSLDVDRTDDLLQLASLAGLLAHDRGDVQTARQHAEHARSLLPPQAPTTDAVAGLAEDGFTLDHQAAVRHLEAELAAARGDLTRVRSLLLPLLSVPGLETFADMWPVALTAVRAEADLSADHPAVGTALPVIESAVERLPRSGAFNTARHLHAYADLARARERDDVEAWRRAADAWRRIEHQPQLGWADLHLAARLVRDGQRDAAQPPLEEAGTIAETLGATRLRERVVDLARRGRIATSLAAGTADLRSGRLARLTARELEVLEHVAAGKSNDELATALYISPKTASVHVSRILSKLDVPTRAKAAVIAYEEGLVVASPGHD